MRLVCRFGPLVGLNAQYTTPLQFSAVNGDSVDLLAGMPVVTTLGSAMRATARSFGQSLVAGIVIGGVSPTSINGASPTLRVSIRPAGLITLPTYLWSVVSGEPAGLTPDALYYLGLEIGTITLVPPSVVGQLVVPLGVARSTTLFSLLPNIVPLLL